MYKILAKLLNPYLKKRGKTVILIWHRNKPQS